MEQDQEVRDHRPDVDWVLVTRTTRALRERLVEVLVRVPENHREAEPVEEEVMDQAEELDHKGKTMYLESTQSETSLTQSEHKHSSGLGLVVF